jgi:surfeit locus 1 family protein
LAIIATDSSPKEILNLYKKSKIKSQNITMRYRFKPTIWMTLATALVMAVCIKLAFWQYNKAQLKLTLQTQLNQRLVEAPQALPNKILNLDDWRYRRVKFTGVYDVRYQLLLDNQVEDTKAGYHVLTPMQVEGSKIAVLIDRGWVPRTVEQLNAAARSAPIVDTPIGLQQIEGDIALPLSKFFTLEAPAKSNQKWEQVWQHIDMKRFAQSVPYPVQPFIVRLDKNSKAGGFVRNWPPPGERVTTHLGYAYQWFGFALTLFIIYIVLNIKKVEH